MCKSIGYNRTSMPNAFHHDSQEEAGLEVHQFWPLVQINCSSDLSFFLCSMYTPICIADYPKPLPACSSVCRRAKAGCGPIMTQYGFSWPDRMNCEDLPKFGDPDNLCMDSKSGEEPPADLLYVPDHLSKFSQPVVPLGPIKDTAKDSKMNKKQSQSKSVVHPTTTSVTQVESGVSKKKMSFPTTVSSEQCKCECLPPLIRIDDQFDRRFYNRVETGGVSNCLLPCHSLYFTPSDQDSASNLISWTSLICLLASFFTVCTFLLDMERFKYPERGIIFISGCYFMVSLGFITRWYFGHEATACDGKSIRYSGTGPPPANCITTFLLIYFFTIASSVWWVILCLTWYLSAGKKWGPEAIAGFSLYFHLLALIVPTIASFIALGFGSVDGDPFIGICSVGNMDTENLRNFILIPLIGCLCLGGVFLFAGFVSMFQLRSVLRQQGTRLKADRLETLMIRIIIFSILYIVPGCCVIACYYYEYRDRHAWESDLTCGSNCFINNISSSQTVIKDKPVYSVFVGKHFASLVVGIFSGFWIWTPKTIDSWCRFFGRMLGCSSSSSSSSSVSGHHYHTPHSTSSHHTHHSARNGVSSARGRNSSHGGHGSVGPLGGSQLLLGAVTGNYISDRHRSSSGYKHIPPGIANQVSYSSTSHIGSSVNGKSIPLTHV